MIDDKVEWCKNPKDFEGFSIRKNGKENGYDVFGLLKGTRDIWLKAGYLTLKGADIAAATQLFMFSFLFVFPLFLRLIWF